MMPGEENINELDVYNRGNFENKKAISLGKCSRYYLLLLGSASCKFISLFLLGNTKNDIGLLGFCSILKTFNFIQSIIIYFGYIIFGIIFLYFKEVKKVELNFIKRRRATKVNLMKTIESKEKSINNKIKLILLCFVFVIHIETKKILYNEGFQFFNFWIIEIIFVLHFMKRYFIMDFYKHHKVSIIFNISVCSILLIIASLLPSSLMGDNSGNAYQNIEIKLGSKFYSILFIFIFLVLSCVYSFTRVYSKILMQIKFISPYKIILIIGIFGFIISIIASIVSYKINYIDNFYNFFSSMRNVLNGEKPYKFWVEIFCIYPLYSFAGFMEITFEIFTIYYLNAFYVLAANTLYFFIAELIIFMLNISSDGLKIVHFVITELTEIFAFLGFMVYLEIIELNFCGLNENIKRRIMEKGEREFRTLSEFSEFDINKEINNDEDDYCELDKKEYIPPYRNI